VGGGRYGLELRVRDSCWVGRAALRTLRIKQ